MKTLATKVDESTQRPPPPKQVPKSHSITVNACPLFQLDTLEMKVKSRSNSHPVPNRVFTSFYSNPAFDFGPGDTGIVGPRASVDANANYININRPNRRFSNKGTCEPNYTESFFLWTSSVTLFTILPLIMVSVGVSFLPACPSKPLIPIALLMMGSLLSFQNCINYYAETCFKVDSLRLMVLSVSNSTINLLLIFSFASFTVAIYSAQFSSPHADHGQKCDHLSGNDSLNPGKMCINDLQKLPSNQSYSFSANESLAIDSSYKNSSGINVYIKTIGTADESSDADGQLNTINNYCNPILYTFSIYLVNCILVFLLIFLVVRVTLYVINRKKDAKCKKRRPLTARV